MFRKYLAFCLFSVLWFAAAPAAAAVSVNAVVSNANVALNGSTSSTSSSQTNLTIAAGSQTALVLLLDLTAGNTTIPTSLACTWGGTTVPLIGSHFDNSSGITHGDAIFGLVAPATGNLTASCTWTNGASWYLTAIAFNGVNQAGGTTSFANFNTGILTPGTSTTPSVTVTSNGAQDIVVGIGQAFGGPSFTSVQGTSTEIFDSTAGNQNAWAQYIAGVSPNVALGANLNTAGSWTISAINVVSAAAALCQRTLVGVGC